MIFYKCTINDNHVTLSDFAGHLFQQIKLERPENFSFKIYAVREILVFKVRPILETSQKWVRKVTKWHF